MFVSYLCWVPTFLFIQRVNTWNMRAEYVRAHTSAFSPLIWSSPGGWRIEIHNLPSGYTFFYIEKLISRSNRGKKLEEREKCVNLLTIGMIKRIVESKGRRVERVIIREGHCGLYQTQHVSYIWLISHKLNRFYLEVTTFIHCFWRANKCNIPSNFLIIYLISLCKCIRCLPFKDVVLFQINCKSWNRVSW